MGSMRFGMVAVMAGSMASTQDARAADFYTCPNDAQEVSRTQTRISICLLDVTTNNPNFKVFRPVASSQIATNCGVSFTNPGEHGTAWSYKWERPIPAKGQAAVVYQGEGIQNQDHCYLSQGLQHPKPQYSGKGIQGDVGPYTWLVDKDGYRRRVLTGATYSACGLPPPVKLPVDTVFRIASRKDPRFVSPPQKFAFAPDLDIESVPDCLAALGKAPAPPVAGPGPIAVAARHPRAGQFVVYNDVYKNVNLVTADGKKRWIGNKDNWTVFTACGLTERNLTYIQAAENNAIPNGARIASGAECQAAWQASR